MGRGPLRSPSSLSFAIQTFLQASRQPAGPDVAGKGFGLFDAHIRFQHHVREIIGDAALAFTLEAPVERQADLMHDAPGDS